MEATPVMTEGPVGSEWAALPWIWQGGQCTGRQGVAEDEFQGGQSTDSGQELKDGKEVPSASLQTEHRGLETRAVALGGIRNIGQ